MKGMFDDPVMTHGGKSRPMLPDMVTDLRLRRHLYANYWHAKEPLPPPAYPVGRGTAAVEVTVASAPFAP
mgnify:CR=1 FL=1